MRLAPALAALALLLPAAPLPVAAAEDVPAPVEACLAAPRSPETWFCLAEASLACGETASFDRCLHAVAERVSAASHEMILLTPLEMRPTLIQERTALRRRCLIKFKGETRAQCAFTVELGHFEHVRRALQP